MNGDEKNIYLNSYEKNINYTASKKYAELAVWEWAEAHPDVDVTTSKINYMFLSFFPPKKNVLEQYCHLTLMVHLQTSFFHFRSLIMTPFPLLS